MSESVSKLDSEGQQSPEYNFEELRQKVRLSDMMNSAGIDRVMALDTSLRVISCNAMCEAFSGLAKDQMLGKHFLELFPEAKAFEAVLEGFEHALKGRRYFVSAPHGAYERGYFERHFMPLKNEEGKVEGVLVIIHDVSHRVAAEDKLKELNTELRRKLRELEIANAELATFTHVTSHDLKEPLRKIYTFVELTITEEQARISDKGRSNLRRVQSSVQRMGLLTDDLVMFAEVSAGDEEAEWLDLSDVLAEAQKPLQKAVNESGAIVDIGKLPRVFLPRRQAVLMMQHLLSNAVKFVEPGTTPRVRVEGDHVARDIVPIDDADADHWCIKITDNGIGIEPEYHDRIFALFQRLHGKGEYGGTGIGLAVCKKIVERRGGFITVDNNPDGGSCFTCWIPSVTSESQAAGQRATASTTASALN